MNKQGFAAMAMSVLAAASILTASGCAPLIVGGAAVTAGATVSTITDRRSAGAIVNDNVLEKRVSWEISQALGRDIDSHITVTAYNGKILLTGEIATEQGRRIAGKTAERSLDVASVVNELAVMENAGLMQRMGDSSLATKVRSRMVGNENVYLSQMKVVVDRDIVYLMGIVTPEENARALNVAATTSGVARVISVCDIMSAERIAQRMRDIQRENEASQTSGQGAQGEMVEPQQVY